jgi:predicted metalloprotease with PDZ domain
MKIRYLAEITDPQNHMIKVTINATKEKSETKLRLFLPSWSPGSYLMREYAKNVRTFVAHNKTGEFLYFKQIEKGIWEIDWTKSEIKEASDEFSVTYEVYCHELTVRTSHIDESHAFLHGPSYLMGVEGKEMEPEIEFKFPPLWMKLHTGLKDVSPSREKFIYSAPSYDDLLDCPVEIGCHESDGFMHDGKEHHLIWYGDQYAHPYNLKEDIKNIVATVAGHFSDIPYENYTFMTHFVKNKYGGLEHKNSTALQFDGRKLKNRSDYVNWLALVAHEYFHTWNVKRIRPVELGPFDYTRENYTTMHWLTEGLTSFMDELFVLRSGLCTLEEYLKMQQKNLSRYYSIPGKKFHSLEDSSFNAWIKLYRPDENSNNSSISYYLKGGLVFSTLHFEFKKKGKNINDLLAKLWARYKENKAEGMNTEEVMQMIEDIAGKDVRQQFELRVATTEDIDFESYYKELGCEFVWEEKKDAYLGIDFEFKNNRVFCGKIVQDGPAYKAGLNAGDEIIAVNRLRFLKTDATALNSIMSAEKTYTFTISRLEKLFEVEVTIGSTPKTLKEIKVVDENKAMDTFVH